MQCKELLCKFSSYNSWLKSLGNFGSKVELLLSDALVHVGFNTSPNLARAISSQVHSVVRLLQ